MEPLPTVLAIDDDKISQKFIARALARQYNHISAFTGEEGIAQAIELCPDIILLDVEMPGMNGYEVCDQLRQNNSTSQIPIVFLSSRSSLRERMLGFESGANDYLPKPFAPEELLAKLNLLNTYKTNQQQLEEKVSLAEETAYTALTGSSELGLAMSFVEQSYNAQNYEMLAFRLFSVTSSLDLKCSLLMLNGDEKLYFSSTGNINPLEEEVIAMLRKDQRFIDFGCRTQINFDHLSLLIKNMPLDDMERYGRIKDLMPSMLGSADAKIQSLNARSAMSAQTNELLNSFNDIKSTLATLAVSLKDNQEKGAHIMRDMLNELEFHLPGMGLEDDQERFIVNLIDGSIHKALDVTDATSSISNSFTHVVSNLEDLIDKQNKCMYNMFANDEAEEETSEQNEQQDPGSMEIELF